MDKKSVLAIIIIALIIILWPAYNSLISPPPVKAPKLIDTVTVKKDTVVKQEIKTTPVLAKKADSVKTALASAPSFWKDNPEKTITINNTLYQAKLSGKGGGTIKDWRITSYKDYTGNDVNFIDGNKNINISFKYRGQLVNLNTANFNFDTSDTLIDLTALPSRTLTSTLNFDTDKKIVITYTFYHNEYHFDYSVSFLNFGDDITNNEYKLEWVSGLRTTEKNITEDLTYFMTYALLGDEKEEFDIGNSSGGETSYTGKTRWVASRTKYFVLFIIPQEKDGEGCSFTGTGKTEGGLHIRKDYQLSLNMKFEPEKKDAYRFYIGPTEYTRLNNYDENLAVILEWGWAIFRPLTKGINYTFKFLYEYIPNYGWVILIFTLFVKILLYPLTHKSYVGMQKMKEVMPRQKEIQKKYKNDPAKMQQEMMKLYKEIGYNPFSGCLPLLIQLPILFPIYQVFRISIDLRQAPFIGWIHDLSVPDTVAVLHTGLPLIGDFNVNPLPIIMTILTFVQQKIAPMTPIGDATDPAQKFNQKFMLYGMPILFFFLFNNFSSGLVLYWTVFNLLTMLQQYMMSKHLIK